MNTTRSSNKKSTPSKHYYRKRKAPRGRSTPRRRRAGIKVQLQVWHEAEGEKLHYVMYDGDNEKRTPLRVVDFPRGCAETQRLMPLVLDALRKGDVLRDKCHEVRFHTTLRGSSVVVLVYNRPIDNDKNWRTKAEKLAKTLKVVLVGRSSKFRARVKWRRASSARETTYSREGYQLVPTGGRVLAAERPRLRKDGDVAVCEAASVPSRERANAIDAGRAHGKFKNDLLELYCGNGNFTIPMSRNFRKVLATEVSKANTECARENLTANK